MTHHGESGGPLSAGDAQRLIQALQLHQVELELQNEQLRESRAEAERARARYTDLYDFAPAAYLTVERDGAIQEANLAAAALLGCDRPALIGTRLAIFLVDEDRVRFDAFLGDVFSTPQAMQEFTVSAREHTAPRLVQIDGVCRADDVGCRLILTDITRHRRLELELEHAQRMESVGRLAGGVAHEFNNLLTIINGYSAILESELPGGTTHQANAREIGIAGERAAALTRKLLTFSRRGLTDPKVVDVATIISDVSKLVAPLLGGNIQLKLSPDADTARVKADPGHLEQMLMNLVDNACDAMPRGGTITIRTSNAWLSASDAASHAGLGTGAHVRITVTDTGDGMDAAVKARLFEPFFTTKEQGQGTGLGLSTVYGIVRQSGGAIAVSSEPGRGASFDILLPAAAPAAPDVTARRADPSMPRGSEKILLVEDQSALRMLARRLLERQGYAVYDADSGEAALRLAAEHNGDFSLLLTDVTMPQMGGRELADAIVARWPSVKVLFMSGYTDDDILRRGVVTSSRAFLQKPFTPAGLADRVRSVLDTKG